MDREKISWDSPLGSPERLNEVRRDAVIQPRLLFTSAELGRLAVLYGAIALLHLLGWGLYLYHARRSPALVGLGLAAYLFGLRHAFDADHISAIDDTVRFMLQKRKSPLGAGFFFSLGHSTVVFCLAAAIIGAAPLVSHALPEMRDLGGLIGAGVSGVFLWMVGILNLVVLLDILKVWKKASAGTHSHAHLDELLARRGFLNRIFGGRFRNAFTRSWQLYPVGVLFGLGFDTASEVGLLAMTAGATAGSLPPLAILSLPILFAAGMSLMDTTDGVIMCKAYHWALLNPLRKIFYNIITTGLSVAVALFVGSIELLQVLSKILNSKNVFFEEVDGIDFGVIGYGIVGLFILAWGISILVWKIGKMNESSAERYTLHSHMHSHKSGITHTHRHPH